MRSLLQLFKRDTTTVASPNSASEKAAPTIAPEQIAIPPTPQATTTQSLPPSAQDDGIIIRKARVQDARNIYDLVNSLSGDGTLLRRNYAELCENIRDFTIAERLLAAPEPGEPSPLGIYAQPLDDRYEFLGCGALHLYGPHLAEVRSIVVKPEAKGLGAGGRLIRSLIEEASDHSIMSVCLFTRLPDFFEHFGFREANREAMPDKIYKDCQTCPRLYACDEVAMVRGPLPMIAVLGPSKIQRPELVQLQLASTGTTH
jgi:amino-acid N-acetyltransferase